MLRVAKNCRGLLREKPQKREAVIVVLRKSCLGEAKKELMQSKRCQRRAPTASQHLLETCAKAHAKVSPRLGPGALPLSKLALCGNVCHAIVWVSLTSLTWKICPKGFSIACNRRRTRVSGKSLQTKIEVPDRHNRWKIPGSGDQETE